MCSNKDSVQPKIKNNNNDDNFLILFSSYVFFLNLIVYLCFLGVHWASCMWALFHHMSSISSLPVNSHVSCPGRSPGHLPIPKHSLELWRVQAWVEGGALETTQSHQPRNWVGPAQNQASTLRFYISSAASPHVHNGTGGSGVLWNVIPTWLLLHDSSLYPEESQQDHIYIFSSNQIKAILKQCVFREAH